MPYNGFPHLLPRRCCQRPTPHPFARLACSAYAAPISGLTEVWPLLDLQSADRSIDCSLLLCQYDMQHVEVRSLDLGTQVRKNCKATRADIVVHRYQKLGPDVSNARPISVKVLQPGQCVMTALSIVKMCNPCAIDKTVPSVQRYMLTIADRTPINARFPTYARNTAKRNHSG